MMKVYECYSQIYINGYWERASCFPAVRLLEEPESLPFYYETFDELWESNCIWIDKEYSLFTKKRYCNITTARRDFPLKITEKNFHKYGRFGYSWKYIEIKEPTMEYLMKNLSADDLIKYLKERDISLENLLTNK